MFKQALIWYAKSEEAFESCYNEVLKWRKPYDNAVKDFEKLCDDRKDVAHCYRSDLLLRGTQTNNFVESQFLVVKDIILKRTTE
jgi:hypothetical protein